MAKTKQATQKKPLYDVHPSIQMVTYWITSLPERTGRSLDEWLNLIRTEAPAANKERCDWLKKQHGFGTNTARFLADRAEGKGTEDGDEAAYLEAAENYVEAMFAGPKAGLRPIYNALIELGRSLGGDIKVCPCKTIVPIFRRYVIAQIKPSTRTRIDFGLALKDTKATGRLLDTGGFAKGDRISHRIEITSLDDIDDEVKMWLKKAYEMDA
jgi:hypothetical protein